MPPSSNMKKTLFNQKQPHTITETRIRELSGTAYFRRGQAYQRSGRVAWMLSNRDGITARVYGTAAVPYLVRVWQRGRQLRWGCACPLGADGEFCKHLVAACLESLHAPAQADTGQHIAAQQEPDWPEIEKSLRKALRPFDRDALLKLLVNRTFWDEHFLEELHLSAQK